MDRFSNMSQRIPSMRSPFPLHAVVFFVVALLAASLSCASAQEPPPAGLEDYVRQALAAWDVPGLAIGIVKDDKLVFAKGFGVRKLGEAAPVDEHTLFAIGSASKAFTAASLAMLMDEGKLKWDDPAARHLPGFQLFDPYVTRELTVRDLLCHRSGLPRGDTLWFGSEFDRDEILRRVRHLKPQWSFRSHFGYQNIMFLAAGQIIPHVAGQSWDDFVRERIFLPLGMNSSSTSVKSVLTAANAAAPHATIDDKLQPIPWRNIDNVGPAGSINSNVVDMSQWIRLQLGGGAIGGTRLLSAAAVKEMHTPQVIVDLGPVDEKLHPDAHFQAYGLGWFMHDYRGRKVIEHGGSIDGMRSEVAIVPEEKLGVVILANRHGTVLPISLMFHVFDAYIGGGKREWSSEGLAIVKQLEEQGKAEKAKQEAARAKDTKPSLPLEKYAGTYRDDLHGEATVVQKEGKLEFRKGPAFVGDLEHWHYDTFRAKFRDRMIDPRMITFRLDAQGKAAALVVGDLGDFERVPEAQQSKSSAGQ